MVSSLGGCRLFFFDKSEGYYSRPTVVLHYGTTWLVVPDEMHLVLSATTKDSDLLDCIERYREVGINRLLFTKLDETAKIGNIFNVVHQSKLPVSYFTTGQSVPDDIEVAQTSRFIQRLLEGSVL